MKKALIAMLLMIAIVETTGCGSAGSGDTVIIGGADGPTSIFVTDGAGDDVVSEKTAALKGIWQTASIAYDDGEMMQPAFYVQFTDSDIIYGHMKDGAFVADHDDAISYLIEMSEGKYRIQAVSSGGVQYTYQTCESDNNVLEYYETWEESDFSDTYSGSASLTRTAETWN